MEVSLYPERSQWKQLLQRPLFDNSSLESVVGEVLSEIKRNGDAALRKFTLKFDKVDLDHFSVSHEEIEHAKTLIDSKLKDAIQLAYENIRKFHESQHIGNKVIETTPGVKCWQKALAIEKVGLYIPGGSAPLFSTVLMLAIPAFIAGCKEVVLCTPPSADGSINPAILYAASLCGVTKIFKLGGVQAVGAMAYGTETVPAVYKIFGPGNQYLTAAKQLVNRQGIAIDMPAGPSEVAVVADKTSNPAFVAADLLSQAEHGPDSQVLLFTTDNEIVEKVNTEITKQLEELPRKDIAVKALTHCRALVLNNTNELMEMVNEYAPEHLILSVDNALELSEMVTNAGSVFIGYYTPESAGDYASGTNHTLPTYGYARTYSGVNLDSFIKKVTFQQISEYGLFNIGPAIETMAETEHLHAHRNAVSIRLKQIVDKANCKHC
jgi:histidinol dehydrogenase